MCGDVESIRVASTLDVREVECSRDPGYGLAHARNLGIYFTNCPLIFPLTPTTSSNRRASRR